IYTFGQYGVLSITTPDPQGWQIDYTYGGGRLTSVSVKNAASGGTEIMSASYKYQYTGSDFDAGVGTQGDLIQVVVNVGNSVGGGSKEQVTQYRYYSDPVTDDGGPHQLKAVYESDAVHRITNAYSID